MGSERAQRSVNGCRGFVLSGFWTSADKCDSFSELLEHLRETAY